MSLERKVWTIGASKEEEEVPRREGSFGGDPAIQPLHRKKSGDRGRSVPKVVKFQLVKSGLKCVLGGRQGWAITWPDLYEYQGGEKGREIQQTK